MTGRAVLSMGSCKSTFLKLFDAATDWFIPADVLGGDADECRRARLVVKYGEVLSLLACVYIGIFLAVDCFGCASSLVVGNIVAVGSLFVMRWTGSSTMAGNVLTVAYFGALTGVACFLGGHGAPVLPWYVNIPVVALLAGRRSAVVWLAMMLSAVTTFYVLSISGVHFPIEPDSRLLQFLELVSWHGLISIVFGLALVYEVSMDRAVVELRSAENRLLHEKNFSDSVIASLPGIFYLFDRQGKFLRWNENLNRVLGYTPEEFSTMHPLQLFQGQNRDVIAEHIEKVFSKGSTTLEAYIRTKDQTEIPYLFSGRRLLIDGKPHLVGTGIDITDRKQAAKVLQQSRERLEQYAADLEATNRALAESSRLAEASARAKSEFLTNMSHEIRTPLTAILGYTDLLLHEGDIDKAPKHRRQAFETVHRNGQHLLEVINGILDMAKVEAGKMEISRARCSPFEVMGEIVSLMRVRADAKQLILRSDVIGPLPETMLTDPLRLRQVLINLVGNAIKFTNHGEIRIAAQLVQDNGPPRLRFTVTDSGIGMSKTQIRGLFQPFGQVDGSAARKFGGTGLGLCLSRWLIEALGGTIDVRSEPGKGSTFFFTIDPGKLDGIRLVEEVPTQVLKPAATAVVADSGATLLNSRILLAEDGPDNQRLIGFLLKKAGAHVTVVENGQLAMAQALSAWTDEQPFDVVLMDMQMPVMDGYEAARTLRESGYPGPIVALTAHAMVGERQKCIDAGCDDYATKPIDRQKLLATVAQWVTRVRTGNDSPQTATGKHNSDALSHARSC